MIEDLMDSHLATGEYGFMFTTFQASYKQILRESISMYWIQILKNQFDRMLNGLPFEKWRIWIQVLSYDPILRESKFSYTHMIEDLMDSLYELAIIKFCVNPFVYIESVFRRNP